MNESIDLTKILEGCPKGTTFYSSFWGEIFFSEILSNNKIKFYYYYNHQQIIIVERNGHVIKDLGECVLFPSKTQRDWSKFERFWDKPKVEKFDVNTLQPFDRILVRFSDNLNWQIGLFGYKYKKLIYSNGTVYYQCIPYNEETKHLVGTANDCPDYYKWWEE